MARAEYSAVGFCIYCGTVEEPLTMEHPVPEGINGEHELPAASCEKCQCITRGFEREALRDILGAARAELSVYGKRHRKRGKTRKDPTFEVKFEGTDGPGEAIQTRGRDYPFSSAWPILDAPGILLGRRSDAPFPDLTDPSRFWIIQANDNTSRVQRLSAKYNRAGKGVSVSLNIPLGPFCRLLAKIAYATCIGQARTDAGRIAIAKLASGIGLLHLIRGLPEAPLAPFLVGCAYAADGSRITSIASGNGMHESIIFAHPYETGHLMFARIQLFALIGAPVYDAVVVMTRDAQAQVAVD
jgi:hypothetical protein